MNSQHGKMAPQIIDQRYVLRHILGEGTYGVVYFATDIKE